MPSCTQPTDLVIIVSGYVMPVVLRPLGQYYLLLGDCYVHGMMEFQASTLIEEFSVKIKEDKAVWKPQGDVRRNGLSIPVGEYRRILGTQGSRNVALL